MQLPAESGRGVPFVLSYLGLFVSVFCMDQVVRSRFSAVQWNESIGLSGLVPWGVVGQWGSGVLFFGIVAAAVWSAWKLWSVVEPWRRYGYWLHALWLAGAVANWLDRVRFGAVRDQIWISGVSLAINLADIAITVAALGTLVWIWTLEHDSHQR